MKISGICNAKYFLTILSFHNNLDRKEWKKKEQLSKAMKNGY